jgi:hypothetical protein
VHEIVRGEKRLEVPVVGAETDEAAVACLREGLESLGSFADAQDGDGESGVGAPTRRFEGCLRIVTQAVAYQQDASMAGPGRREQAMRFVEGAA